MVTANYDYYSAEVNDGDTSNDATLALTFTSSEATTNFAANDITVTNGAIGNFASTSSKYTQLRLHQQKTVLQQLMLQLINLQMLLVTITQATRFNWTYDSWDQL